MRISREEFQIKLDNAHQQGWLTGSESGRMGADKYRGSELRTRAMEFTHPNLRAEDRVIDAKIIEGYLTAGEV